MRLLDGKKQAGMAKAVPLLDFANAGIVGDRRWIDPERLGEERAGTGQTWSSVCGLLARASHSVASMPK